MLLFAIAAIAAVPPPSPTRVVAQATATIRVVRAVEVRLDGSASRDAPPPRLSAVRTADGLLKPVKLIEFE